MRKRIKSAENRSKSSIISRNGDEEDAVRTFMAEMKYSKSEHLRKSSHNRLRSTSVRERKVESAYQYCNCFFVDWCHRFRRNEETGSYPK